MDVDEKPLRRDEELIASDKELIAHDEEIRRPRPERSLVILLQNQTARFIKYV